MALPTLRYTGGSCGTARGDRLPWHPAHVSRTRRIPCRTAHV